MEAIKDIWNKAHENMKRNTYRPDETETQIRRAKSETTRLNHQNVEISEIH